MIFFFFFLENKFGDSSVDDESLASQHFHIDVGGNEGGEGKSDFSSRKVIYYPRELLPQKPRAKDVTGLVGRTPLPGFFIQPYGFVWVIWSALIAILSLYELLMVPIVIAWPFLGNPGMYVWDYVVDTLFIFDVFLQFYVALTPHTYYLVTDRTTITLRYAWGWFPVDVVASMPLDLFVWAANGYQARNFTRLLKLLHIFRLYRALHALASRVKERWNTFNEKWVLYNPNIERFVGLALFIYLMCSIAGSFWITYSTAVGFGSSFFAAPITLSGQSFGAQYLYAFYWAFYAYFGLSTLSLRPSTIGETFFALVMGILGLGMIVALVAELANLMRVMDNHRSRWMEAQQRLNFSQKRKEVQQWLRAMLNSEPLFKAVDPAVIHALAIRCRFKAFPKDVAVIVEDTPPGAAIFMVRKGALEESRNGVHQGYIGRGTVFNVKGMLQPALNAPSTYTTVRHSELFVLRRRDVFKVAQMYPKFAAILATRL